MKNAKTKMKNDNVKCKILITKPNAEFQPAPVLEIPFLKLTGAEWSLTFLSVILHFDFYILIFIQH